MKELLTTVMCTMFALATVRTIKLIFMLVKNRKAR